MKRALILLLICLLLGLPSLAEQPAGAPTAPQPAKYTGALYFGVEVYERMDFESPRLGFIARDRTVEILEVEPAWLKVRYKGLEGYIKRQAMLDSSIRNLDPQANPTYGTVPNAWLAWVKEEAPILAAPQADAKALITMREGARLALIDIEDGWGRLIYHRQYGYINTNHLSEIQPINFSGDAGYDAPMAAYTSFYRLTTDQSNLNRIVNLEVAGERFKLYTLNTGDRLDFNQQIGPYSRRNGYLPANALVKGETVQSYGGGTCQVSSTLFNAVLQLPQIAVLKRRPHGPSAAAYLPHGADAAVGSVAQNFIIQNQFAFPIRIDSTVQDGALTIAIYRCD